VREEVQYSRATAIPGLVLSAARFADFRFEPHYHLDFHIGLVTEGVQRQSFKGESLLLTPGTIQLMPAGEVHDGDAAEADAYTLQTFRLDPSLLASVGEEITGKHYFPSQAAAVLQDPGLAWQLLRLHSTIGGTLAEPLETETYLIDLFDSLFARLRQPAPQVIAGRLTQAQLMRVRDFMEASLAEKISLEELAALVNLDRFRFLKQFKSAVGMTPHAWLLRLRLETALKLIQARAGITMTELAHAVGFFDQSHFTRAFRTAYGTTPARFQQTSRNFLQGSAFSHR
jgi:AraC-like DNA-binding protein